MHYTFGFLPMFNQKNSWGLNVFRKEEGTTVGVKPGSLL
jgi:hypothetical protein